MISPQSTAIGAGAVGLVGKESDLFRFTLKHSFIMLAVICLLTMMQAYVMPWIIPDYDMTPIPKVVALSAVSTGFIYLGWLGLTVVIIAGVVWFMNRRGLRLT